MRLLVRANSHRHVAADVIEVASSPDTPKREGWLWSVRIGGQGPLDDRAEGAEVVQLADELNPAGTVVLAYDPSVVEGALERFDLESGPVRRDRREVAVLVAATGALVEGRLRLRPGDAMVLEGDDAMEVSVEGVEGGSPRVVVARLGYVDGSRMAWVP